MALYFPERARIMSGLRKLSRYMTGKPVGRARQVEIRDEINSLLDQHNTALARGQEIQTMLQSLPPRSKFSVGLSPKQGLVYRAEDEDGGKFRWETRLQLWVRTSEG